MNRREFHGAVASLVAAAVAPVGTIAEPMSRVASSENADQRYVRVHERTRRFAQTTFGRIAYIERGRGAVALLLHGFPLNSFQWRAVIDALLPLRRCIAPDLLGCGLTQVRPGQGVTPTEQVDMLVSLLDHLSVGSVDLIANDSGGALAQLLVMRDPALIRTMLLTNCDVEIDSPPAALKPIIEMAHAGTYPDRCLTPALTDKALARSTKGIGGMCYSNPAHPSDTALEQYLRPLVESAERKALVNAYIIGLEHNPLAGSAAALRTAHVPTRIVWGMADTIFSTSNPEYLASVLPNVMGITRLKKAKLFFPEEYPDTIAAEARALWAQAKSQRG